MDLEYLKKMPDAEFEAWADAITSLTALKMNELAESRFDRLRAMTDSDREVFINAHDDEEQRRSEAEMDASICVRCLGFVEIPIKDHVIPLYQEDSTDDISNLQPLCQTCNCAKGPDRTNYLEIWRRRNRAPSNV